MITKPLITKIALGVLGIGGIGVVGHQGYRIFNKEKTNKRILNGNKLIDQKFVLLNEKPENETHWKTILNSYKRDTKNLKFSGFDGNGEEANALITLKQKCNEALNNEEESLFTKARKWCVTPIKASELLKNRNNKVLKTEASKPNDEKEDWKKRINEFKEANKKNTELNRLITIKEGIHTEPENILEMKKKCKEFGDTESHSEKFEENLKNILDWCVAK